jgi:hypothetical protein
MVVRGPDTGQTLSRPASINVVLGVDTLNVNRTIRTWLNLKSMLTPGRILCILVGFKVPLPRLDKCF